MNLLEGLHEQMDRARELRKEYECIPMGFIGVTMIDQAIKQAEQSIANGDAVDMLSAYKSLEGLE